MQEQGLVSNYTAAQYKLTKSKVNEEPVENLLNREFDGQEELGTIISDLTYVCVNGKWNYICLFVDLFNHEIICHSAGPHKTAALVYKALSSVNRDLNLIQMFHTDRGSEFKNNLIDESLKTFGIKIFLSMKGCPYDIAVVESMFNIVKTEFTNSAHFNTLEQLILELNDYVNWYNNIRIHGTLGYKSPLAYRLKSL